MSELGNMPINGDLSSFLLYTTSNSKLLPSWWSEQREQALKRASISIDIISSVISVLSMRLYNLPLLVVPKNQMISSHYTIANTYQTIINNAWLRYGELFIEDILTQDKGGFFFVDSTTAYSVPLTDIPTGLTYAPASQVMLYNSPEYPYILLRYRQPSIFVHHSRVIRLIQRPIAIDEYASVGLSFVSRAFNVGQMLASAINYGLESLGQLDSDTIIWATSTTSKAIQSAFKDAQIDSYNEGKQVKGGRVYLGLRDPQGKIGQLELKRLPDTFSYKEFTEVTIKLLALAAGVDENDLIAVSGAGTTKSAALISDIKAKFKLETWFATRLTQELQQKFLPGFLKLQVGNESEDLNESRAKARINLIRSDKLLAEFGALSDRTARMNAVKYGLINDDQFAEMELNDGRLVNGLHVTSIFMLENEMIQGLIGKKIDPYNLPEFVTVEYIQKKLYELNTVAINTTSNNIFAQVKQIIAAFEWLLAKLNTPITNAPTAEEQNEEEDDTDTEDEEENTPQQKTQNTEEPTKKSLEKKYYKPSTVNGRRHQKIVRELVRNVWDKKKPRLLTSVDELKTATEQAYIVDNEKLFEVVRALNTNAKSKTLSEWYAIFDEIFGF